MLFISASLLHQQSETRSVRKNGLENGLESPGCWWISVDYPGTSKAQKIIERQRLEALLGFPWNDEVERVKGIEPSYEVG
jgi:hypothetical protein